MVYHSIYWRHYQLASVVSHTKKEAIDFLINGEDEGFLSSVGVVDSERQVHPAIEVGYDWSLKEQIVLKSFDKLGLS